VALADRTEVTLKSQQNKCDNALSGTDSVQTVLCSSSLVAGGTVDALDLVGAHYTRAPIIHLQIIIIIHYTLYNTSYAQHYTKYNVMMCMRFPFIRKTRPKVGPNSQ
jgi:hypothetical protein